MSAPVPLSSGCCSSPCPTSPTSAVPGPAGENAFSFTAGSYVQPGVNATVTVSLTHDGWIIPGQTVFVLLGGFYTVVSVSGLNVTLQNLGGTNAIPGVTIPSGSEISPSGPPGFAGNAFTVLQANYVQPAVNSQVTITVGVSSWAALGQFVFVSTGGTYTVFGLPDATHMVLTNTGATGNAVPGTTILAPQNVSPAGPQGSPGSPGPASLNAASPTTTKGDLIVDNGVNSPLASDVRLGVGTNGKALVANSTQPTGLGYSTITPNSVANSGNLAIYNGTTGTPVALQDSLINMTGSGALQSTPTGGNARGTSAIDLQVVRASNTQVASANESTIAGGQNNTASGVSSTVGGGNGNNSAATGATVAGGTTNTSSGANSFSAGTNNTASGGVSTAIGGGNTASQNACVALGSGNTASSNQATVGGGLANTASGINSVIPGGANNTASAEATVCTGENSKAYLFGQRSHAAGDLATQGDRQISDLIMSDTTGDATPTELFLNGAFTALRAVVPLTTTWAFHIIGVGRSSAGVCAVFEVKGGIQNNGGTVTLVAAVTTTVIADGTGSTWGVAGGFVVTADNVNKSLKITVTGAVATNISWVARVHLTEVSF